jgi:hypothetical protein
MAGVQKELEARLFFIGLTQTTDSIPFVGHFSPPPAAKNDLQKQKSTIHDQK